MRAHDASGQALRCVVAHRLHILDGRVIRIRIVEIRASGSAAPVDVGHRILLAEHEAGKDPILVRVKIVERAAVVLGDRIDDRVGMRVADDRIRADGDAAVACGRS